MKKIKHVISFLVFTVLLAAAILWCADVVEYKDARKKYTAFYKSDTNFDVLLLGTSHMWNHVLPMELWRDSGLSSYNWGYANCTPAETWYLLPDILKFTSPRVIVLDAFGIKHYDRYGNGKYRTDRIEQQHVQFDSLPFSMNKVKAARDVFDDYPDNADFIWNFIMYHNRWSSLSEEDFAYSLSTEKGSNFRTGLGTVSPALIPEDQKTEISSVCLPYFLNIISYCEKRDIPVLCLYIPFAAGEQDQRIANTVPDLLEGFKNCTYVNLMHEGIVDFETDTSPDNTHLNYSGALKVTEWLGEYLSRNYTLDNYAGNASWKADYEKYLAFKEETLLGLGSLPEYLVQLRDSDLSAEAVIYDENLFSSARLMHLFDNAGITPAAAPPPEGTNCCAALTIRETGSGRLLEEASFSCADTQNLDIMKIKKDTAAS